MLTNLRIAVTAFCLTACVLLVWCADPGKAHQGLGDFVNDYPPRSGDRRGRGRQTTGTAIEIAGPQKIRMDDLVRQYLIVTRERRKVKTDPYAG